MYEAKQRKEKVSRRIDAAGGMAKQQTRSYFKNREEIKLNHGCTSSILQLFMSVDEFKKSTPISKTQHRRKLRNIDSAITDLDEDVKTNIGLHKFKHRLDLLKNLKKKFKSYSGKRNLTEYEELLKNEITASKNIKTFRDTYRSIPAPKSLQDSKNKVENIKKYIEELKKYEQINGRNVSSLKANLYDDLNTLSRNVYDMYIKTGNTTKYKKAIKFLNKTYFDDNITIKVDAGMKPSTHASTGGRINENNIDNRSIKFNPNYLSKMNDSTMESFYKVINTLKHERKHFEQRSDPNYSIKTTKEEREFMAYSEELIKTEGIPQLVSNYYTSTYNKMKKQYNAIIKNTSIDSKKKLDYTKRFNSIPQG